MSQQARLIAVEYAVLVHATEDFDKVIRAIENLMPPRLRERKKLEVEETYGHYDNPIRVVKVSFRNPEHANQVFDWIWSRLSEDDRASLIRNLELHLDNKLRLYMRLDKQDAFLGSAKLSPGDDVIKVVFTFRGSKEAVKGFLLSHGFEGVRSAQETLC